MSYPTRARNQKIIAKKRAGATYAELGREFKRSKERIRQIVEKQEKREAMKVIPEMEVKLFNILRQVLKMEHPTLIDFKRFIDENENWQHLLRYESGSPCGPKMIAKYEKFARENGLIK